MSYCRSQLDKDNFKWFKNDGSRNSLVGITTESGNIRGVFPCDIQFTYPITAFVGENGSGKTTMLALAACAFHNDDTFHQFSRKKSYFTYGDFFTFSAEETGLQGIKITYTIRQLEAGNTVDKPNIRRKKPSGKWNDFNTRPFRNVIYLGIHRIVPPSESSAHRSYRNHFKQSDISEPILSKVKTMAGRIFGRNYSALKILLRNTYRLFVVERNDFTYSGFNMGAGENAVISILLDLLLAGPGALMVIDEIELGLHAKAQKEFIQVLKEICSDQKCQIICSTHSSIVLNSLPPEARFFIQNQNSQTIITPQISAEFAFGKLAGQNTQELDVFVEDSVGKSILQNILPKNLRERVQIYDIGSDQAVLKQVAAHYREKKINFIAFLDGDKRNTHQSQIATVKKHLECRIDSDDVFCSIIDKRLCYIPGNEWPERSLLQYIKKVSDKTELISRWSISTTDDINSFLEQALLAEKHDEFFRLAELLADDESAIRNDCIKFFRTSYPDLCNSVCSAIEVILNSV